MREAGFVDAGDFGRSVSLGTKWLAAPGDNPAWARPEFDDSKWIVLDPDKPLSSQGFGGAPYLWYRLHVKLSAHAPPAALYVNGLGKNYAVYANGQLVGGQGGMRLTDLDQEHPIASFPIPTQVQANASGELVLAIRVNGGPIGFYNVDPFDPDTTIELLHPSQTQQRRTFGMAQNWDVYWVLVGLDLLVGTCGLVIWFSLREQREYLALAVWLLSSGVSTLVYYKAHISGATVGSGFTYLNLLLRGVTLVGELEFMRLLLRERRSNRWLALEVICVVIGLLVPSINTGQLPLMLGGILYFAQLAITELFITALLVRGAWRGNREAPVLLLPVLLWSFTDVYRLLGFSLWGAFRIKLPELLDFHIGTHAVHFATLTDIVGLLCLLLIIIRRTVRLSQEKAELSAEVAAAEQLQLLLMARASRPTPGYRVETAYRPMQQVGGDFFLVQPCEEDQSLVAIVGDVSGKGLQAAMRVSLILGVLQREVMGQPDRVLTKLNRALLDQNDIGFTTACCVRLEANGHFCFANAGHLNPYLDGQEIATEGSLPLGIDAEAAYAVSHGRLEPGQRLVLLSDGVLEARTRKGELLGFERMGELLNGEVGQIAAAAQEFGQEDDITVLAVALN